MFLSEDVNSAKSNIHFLLQGVHIHTLVVQHDSM